MAALRVALVTLLLALAAAAQTIELQDGAFRVSGWKPDRPVKTEDLSSIFTVHSGGADAPAILGAYSVEGEFLVFRPRFPLAAGVRYRAVFHRAGSSPIETVFDQQRVATLSARIEHVYPSRNLLPSNQLKLYIYFSAPMSRGEASRRIHWLDRNGKAMEPPFLIAEELWDPDQRRLTLFFDPGRIKRGLDANVELGPPIREGAEYTLVIDREFLDAHGVPLEQGLRKLFRGAPADRTPIDPKQWSLKPPRAGTSDALIVDFPKPMDYALLERLLTIPGVSGTVSIDREETRWTFTPNESWRPGKYELKVDLALEDLAGNRIDRAFDVDTSQSASQPATTATTTSLPFLVH